MARASSAVQQRALSLTEELERLEQSITLTLQEIDHNFSKAHRIVTSSILPIVEQYASHSKDVWEGSKFWKQFFESSANVSLSGYEEQQSTHESVEETVTEESNATTHTTLEGTSQSYDTPSAQHMNTDSIQDLDLSNLTLSPSHSTPRPSKKQVQPNFADYPSPYEALKQEVNNTTKIDATSLSFSNDDPQTPGRRTTAQDVAMTPETSPRLPRQQVTTTIPQPNTARKDKDPLLHRILDRNYRIQATPLTTNRHKPTQSSTTPATTTRRNHVLDDSNLSSSPEAPPPQLHAEIFSSPERGRRVPPQPSSNRQQAQRTPGVSVLTPARKKPQYSNPPTRTPGAWDSESDEDDENPETGMPFGASPPKTMQFHIPQSRLLKTPAKEASKRIVDDILETAGMGRTGTGTAGLGQEDTDDFDIDIDIDVDVDADYDDLDEDTGGGYYDGQRGNMDENSPSVVRKAVGLEDEIFQ